MLNGHSSTKVGSEPGSIGKETDEQAVRAGSTARVKRGQTLGMQETHAGHGIVVARAGSTAMEQTTFVEERVAPPELKAGSPIACTASSVR